VLTTAVAVQRVTLTVSVGARGAQIDTYSGLSTHPSSPSYIATVLRSNNPTDPQARIYFGFDPSGTDPSLTLTPTDFAALFVALTAQTSQSQMQLQNGSDGVLPSTSDLWVGDGADATAKGLTALADVDDIAIVAAPDCSTFDDQDLQQSIRDALITHCENLKYRFAILSGPDNADESKIQNVRSQMDSTYAAIYYPWVTIEDPFSQTGQLMNLPPEGYMAGIYARSDDQRGVYKAPANEVVLGALRFARNVNKGSQDVLNPNGINCLRFFQDRGYRVWGARTISSDPDWTYLNVRRLFIYLEHSIDKSTQWVVFEPNNQTLWTKVRLTIESFLLDVWRTGALLGSKPEEAFFVRCDRSTMTQSDLDNGRLVVLIGVAPTKPAEFVIFRIGQWTADASII
jgi:phage tail sheath protein FI